MRAIRIQPGIVARSTAYSSPRRSDGSPPSRRRTRARRSRRSRRAQRCPRAGASAASASPGGASCQEARRCSRISSVRWFANTVLGAAPTDGSAYELSKLISAMLSPTASRSCSRRGFPRLGASIEGMAVGPFFKARVAITRQQTGWLALRWGGAGHRLGAMRLSDLPEWGARHQCLE